MYIYIFFSGPKKCSNFGKRAVPASLVAKNVLLGLLAVGDCVYIVFGQTRLDKYGSYFPTNYSISYTKPEASRLYIHRQSTYMYI